MDFGLYYVLDVIDFQQLNFPPVSGDIKWKFLGSDSKHFALATGLGIGTGVERSLLYNDIFQHSSEDQWYYYGGTSVDGYVPLYFSAIFNLWGDRFSFNYNPFMVYRFGFYDSYHTSNSGSSEEYFFRPMNKALIGNAFSIGMGDDKFSVLGVLNIEKYPDSKREFENVEAYITFSYKIDLLKFKKKKVSMN
jgi:hypothetical protein